MPLQDDVKIAGDYTVGCWKQLRNNLHEENDSNNENWQKALKIFNLRVETRFITPIKAILNISPEGEKGKGEGFSAVALQCILIEFFEAFYQGKIYNSDRDNLKENEYSSSASLFKDFLKKHEPFKSQFTKDFREKIYREFRCGLLHEAATKGSSIIRTKKTEEPDKLIEKEKDSNNIILYRTPFQKALEKYLEDYGKELMSSKELKEAFIRKMDDLCQITTI